MKQSCCRTRQRREIVINTGPLIALAAALDELEVLRDLYRRVHVPNEVGREIRAKGAAGFAAVQFEQANWLHKAEEPFASIQNRGRSPAETLRNPGNQVEKSAIYHALWQKTATSSDSGRAAPTKKVTLFEWL